MKLSCPFLTLLVLIAAAGSAAGDPLPRGLAPDIVEGALVAATCLGSGDRTQGCQERALAAGQPGGIRDGQRFTMLLVDGRILGRTCAARTAGRLRAFGVLHRGGVAMSLFRLEHDCGRGWTIVDLPHTGTAADGAAGGDE
ncbi:MAG TPA: hypothetical protein VHN14_34050 [Kofleriaceae bacterium]|jgi:hypothetical protein|nr:hypothetical protein [Kofleriaceae bacterium]